jgi:hypothetical protein
VIKVENKKIDVNKYYEENILPEEIGKLPYDKLSPYEQNIVFKIENKQHVTRTELKKIKKTVKRYKQFTRKYDVEKTVESAKKLQENITTEQELLDIFDNEKRNTIHMHLNVNGEGYRDLYFKIKPLDDSRAIKFSEQHIDLYRDMSDKEKETFRKAQNNKPMSKEEQDVVEELNKRLMETQITDKADMINEFLAYQVTPPDYDGDIEKRKEFWKTQFPFYPRIALFIKLMDYYGLNSESEEKLFPTSN